MNERIRELMQQAGTDTSGKWMGVDHAEKFAELIVRELADQFPKTFTDEQYQRRIDKTILKHFGVEQ